MSAYRPSVAPRLTVVSNELPVPPYAADIKANGYRPEVDWQRIKASKTWRLCQPEQRNNLLRLWMECWNEVPAGSWEDDDEIIAAAIDMPIRLFQAHRDQLMRGWYLAADGRLYHPVIAEMVMAMVEKRRDIAKRVRDHRERRKSSSQSAPKPELSPVSNDGVTRYQPVSNAQEQEQEQEQEELKLPRSANALVESALGGHDLEPEKPGGATDPPPDAAKPVVLASVAVRSVFDYWREVMEHPNAVLDNKRSRAIAGRLKHGYSVEQLKRAVDGCRASPWHQGQNDRHQVYDDIELICRDAKRVEAFLTKAEVVSQHQRDEQRELDAWLNEGACIEGEFRHVQA